MGGAGGAASATMTTTDTTASSVVTSVTANGGGGGSTDYGTPGAGGSATATVTATSTSATSVTGSATAAGGGAGYNYGSALTYSYGAGGNASASVAVSANNGYGQAVASATGGYGTGTELANATASVINATSGYAQATSESQGTTGSVTTTANAPVGGPASAVTEANINSALPAVALTNGEAVSIAELTPGGTTFGVGGFGAESDGSATSLTYNATADFVFLTTTSEDIYLNLTSGVPSGDAFQSLTFGYDINSDGWVYNTFTTVAEADAFFTDNSINLGEFAAGTQNLDLSYAFTAEGDAPGYVVTYNTSGTGIAPTIPEPSTWAMMLIGFAGLSYVGWRRANRAKAAAA